MPGENTQEPTLLGGELVVDFSAFAVAAGLAPDAGRTDIVNAIAASRTAATGVSSERQAREAAEAKATAASASLKLILDATGTSTAAEACGVISAWKQGDADGKAAIGELAKVKADGEKAESARLIEAAVKDGRIYPSENRAKVEKIYADFGIAALQAHLGALTPHPALARTRTTQHEREEATDDGVVLTAEDEKAIERSGLPRADFIAARKRILEDERKARGGR